MFSKLQIASAFAVFATATAAIPADVSCGYTGNGFCLYCPVDETLSVTNSGGSTVCTCTKPIRVVQECKVFTLDGKPSTLAAFNQATYVPGDGFTTEDDAKEACWNAAPAAIDKSTQINVSKGSLCTTKFGDISWSMSGADAAKFEAISSAQMAAFAFAPLCVLLAMA